MKAEISGGPTFQYDGTVPEPSNGEGGPGLRIRFEVTQKDLSTPNVLNLFITNPAPSRVQPALYENKSVTLNAGFAGNFGLLFKGQIRQARVIMENVTDRVLHILATDMGRPRNYAVLSSSLSSGHTLRDRANLAIKAFEAMGVKTGYICPLAPDVKFSRSFAFSGPAHELMRQVCQAAKASWSIQNGTQQIVPNDTPHPGKGIITLNRNTGLIGLAEQTIQGIEGRALLNPQIVPTSVVKIDDAAIQRAAISPGYTAAPANAQIQKLDADGNYKIYYVGHSGDTRGGDFLTSFIGTRLSQNRISAAMAARGITPNYPNAPAN
ncbi:hypothetical protein [Methylobacterium phyllostachyos]|uniref:hypothetical protein n=1 Tax=Methylobacterium phyllostachyos TaxID=582672 RepID=UPI00115FAE23|nr:hypothetical protein [Methylobacterium phyllostachyos]